jgi:hypothetical protein
MSTSTNISAEGFVPPHDLPPRFRKNRFNTPEASAYFDAAHGVTVAESYLEKMRSVGGGPDFRLFGRNVFYDKTALDAWVMTKLSEPLKNTVKVPKSPRPKKSKPQVKKGTAATSNGEGASAQHR